MSLYWLLFLIDGLLSYDEWKPSPSDDLFFLEHNTNNSVIQIDDVSWCVFAGARKGEGERTSIFLDSQTNGRWIL